VTIVAFDHFTVRCADLQASWNFYQEVLGLRVTERTGINIPAAIVSMGDAMLVHLFQADPGQEAIFARLKVSDPEAAQWGTGRLHHVALQATGLPEIRQRLTDAGIAFTERTLTRLSKHLVLVKDPDNVEIELSFALSEVDAPV
jgi:catechol 2,3-dioxygenase-like lactoylglutathione lyase family enzyme